MIVVLAFEFSWVCVYIASCVPWVTNFKKKRPLTIILRFNFWVYDAFESIPTPPAIENVFDRKNATTSSCARGFFSNTFITAAKSDSESHCLFIYSFFFCLIKIVFHKRFVIFQTVSISPCGHSWNVSSIVSKAVCGNSRNRSQLTTKLCFGP